jgi:microcystin-dependent protein
MSNKKITDLAYYPSSSFQPNDLWFITDIGHQETKNTTTADILGYAQNHLNYSTGSYTGSFSGSLYGTASWANNSISSSYAFTSSISNYALTASFALNSPISGGGNFSEVINQAHTFNIGDPVAETGTYSTKTYLLANSTYPYNTNEVIGIVQATSSNTSFTLAYGGVIDFGTNLPSYYQPQGSISNANNGVAYFLSASSLSINDPSLTDSTQISKPLLIKLDNTRALIINQRGMYENTQAQQSAVSASYSLSGSYALTASYALNGGSGGGGNTNNNYYTDSTPIGSIVASAASTAPAGYISCDGSYLLISSYPDLFTAIYVNGSTNNISTFGQIYNIQGGSTYVMDTNAGQSNTPSYTNGKYFKIPDLRGQFVRGFNNGQSSAFGNVTSTYDNTRIYGSLQSDTLKSHTHTIQTPKSAQAGADNGGAPVQYSSNNTSTTWPTFWTTDGTGGTETRPVNIALNYYIKYTQLNIPSSNIINTTLPIGGDVIGTVGPNQLTTVNAIKGINVTYPNNLASGMVLTYNGSTWTAATPAVSNNVSVGPTVVAAVSFNPNETVYNSPYTAGTPTITYQYNVSSLLYGGRIVHGVSTGYGTSYPVYLIGNYTINFTTALTNSNYYIVGSTNSLPFLSYSASPGQGYSTQVTPFCTVTKTLTNAIINPGGLFGINGGLPSVLSTLSPTMVDVIIYK